MKLASMLRVSYVLDMWVLDSVDSSVFSDVFNLVAGIGLMFILLLFS